MSAIAHSGRSQRPRPRIPPRPLAAAAALLALLVAAPAATAAEPNPPAPPSIGLSCSDSERAFLRESWREAYRYVYRGDQLLDFIASRPAADRAELWGRGHSTAEVPSPRRYFGPYAPERFATVRTAIERMRQRMLRKGDLKIAGLLCLQVTCRKSPGAKEPGEARPSAFHAPPGVIVTCPKWWGLKKIKQRTLSSGAFMVIHEGFHWLKLATGLWVTDYHSDGKGPHPNEKYYGIGDVTYLAENAPGWAIANNDSYAYFLRAVGTAPEATYSAVFADKEAGGVGALWTGISWDQLVAYAKAYAPGQYLADVETSFRHGKRVYTGVWRIGSGGEAPVRLPATTFEGDWAARKATKDLVDVEPYFENGVWSHIGVYRARASAIGELGAATTPGRFAAGMRWEDLDAAWKAGKPTLHLADVESYLVGGQRRFAAVWLPGFGGPDGLFASRDRALFDSVAGGLNATQQMLDYETWLEPDGARTHVATWHAGAVGRQLLTDLTWPELLQKRQELGATRTMIDVDQTSTLAAEVR